MIDPETTACRHGMQVQDDLTVSSGRHRIIQAEAWSTIFWIPDRVGDDTGTF